MPRFVFFVVAVILQVQCQYITWNFNPRMNLFWIIFFNGVPKKNGDGTVFWVTVWKTTVWINRNLFLNFIVESSTIQSTKSIEEISMNIWRMRKTMQFGWWETKQINYNTRFVDFVSTPSKPKIIITKPTNY